MHLYINIVQCIAMIPRFTQFFRLQNDLSIYMMATFKLSKLPPPKNTFTFRRMHEGFSFIGPKIIISMQCGKMFDLLLVNVEYVMIHGCEVICYNTFTIGPQLCHHFEHCLQILICLSKLSHSACTI